MKEKITFKSIIVNLDCIITCVTLFFCVLFVNLNVLMRYIFNNPLQWCEEVVTSLFVWTVFIGSAYAYRKHSHLGVDIIVNLFKGKAKEVITFIVSIIELGILIMLTIISSQYVYHLIVGRNGIKILLTELLRVPKWWTGIAVPIGFGLSVIYSIYFFLRDRLHVIKAKEEPKEEKSEEVGEGLDHEVTGGNF